VSGITGSITDAVGSAGVYAVFGLMAFDAVFPAVSEVVMLYAGALAAGAFPAHHVTLFGADITSKGGGYVVMALAGALGYWLGGLLGWAIGYVGGRPLLDRWGRFLHLSPAKVDRAEEWFRRHGLLAVFLARNVPVVRSFISIPAGVAEMPFGPYALLSLLGSLPWAFGFAGAGLALGTGWERVHRDFKYADYVVLALIVAAALFLVLRFLRGRGRSAHETV
jgi:membrane protein DedA with SNARE-associated domain